MAWSPPPLTPATRAHAPAWFPTTPLPEPRQHRPAWFPQPYRQARIDATATLNLAAFARMPADLDLTASTGTKTSCSDPRL